MSDIREIPWTDAYSIKVQSESIEQKVRDLLIRDDGISKKVREELRYMLSSAEHITKTISDVAKVDREALAKRLSEAPQ